MPSVEADECLAFGFWSVQARVHPDGFLNRVGRGLIQRRLDPVAGPDMVTIWLQCDATPGQRRGCGPNRQEWQASGHGLLISTGGAAATRRFATNKGGPDASKLLTPCGIGFAWEPNAQVCPARVTESVWV